MAHMIEQNDNLFSVGETPWHGLGVVLPEAPSIDEALEISGLNWNVRTLDLTAKQPHIPGQLSRGLVHLPDYKALQREDTEEIFTVVSSQYTVLQNTEAFNVFRPLVESGELTLETAGSLNNGRRVWILAKVTGSKEAQVQSGDKVKLYTLLSNSHDGSQAVRFGFCDVRVVCNNTLTGAHADSASKLIKLYHRGDLTGAIENLRETMDLKTTEFKANIRQYKELAKSKIVNPEDLQKYVKIVLGLPLEELDKTTPREALILQVLYQGKGATIRKNPEDVTWWDAYNAVNEWGLYHRGYTADSRLNSMWFADGYSRDHLALETAMKFAA